MMAVCLHERKRKLFGPNCGMVGKGHGLRLPVHSGVSLGKKVRAGGPEQQIMTKVSIPPLNYYIYSAYYDHSS